MAESSLPSRLNQTSRLPAVAGAVGEDPVARRREPRQARGDRPDALGYGHGLAGRLHRLGVEGLRDERALPHEEEISRRRVGHQGLGGSERPRFLRVERADPIEVLVGLLALGHVEKVPPVGQELRPGDHRLLARGVGLDGDRRRPSLRGDSLDGIGGATVEEDHSRRAPGSVRTRRVVADLLRRAPGDLDLLQLPFGEESEETAVGRPERAGGSLGPRQGLSDQSAQRPHPDAGSSRGIAGVERQDLPVGRDSRRVDQRDSLGSRDLESDRTRLDRSAAHVARGEEPRGDDRRRGHSPGQPLAALPPCRDGHRHPACEPALGDPLELQLDVVRRLEPVLRVLGEARLDDAVQGRRRHRRDLVDRRRIVAEDRADQARLALAREGLPSRRHLVEHGAEREDVRARVGLAAFELLRRHVLEGAEHRAPLRQRLARLGLRRQGRGSGKRAVPSRRLELRQTEVEELDPALRQHHVAGLQVAMDDALPVRLVQRVGDLDAEAQELLGGKRRPCSDARPASLPRGTP